MNLALHRNPESVVDQLKRAIRSQTDSPRKVIRRFREDQLAAGRTEDEIARDIRTVIGSF